MEFPFHSNQPSHAVPPLFCSPAPVSLHVLPLFPAHLHTRNDHNRPAVLYTQPQPQPTPEVAVFDLLGIPLVHGWLVDPQDRATAAVFSNKSYNELVEMLFLVSRRCVNSLKSWFGQGLMIRRLSRLLSRLLSSL
jgi:hypothetical protein